MGMAPRARYTKSGDVHIAHFVIGDGPQDIVWVPAWISQAEHLVTEPQIMAGLQRIASFGRLIMWDRRGSGMSDPVVGVPTLEEQIDDVLAVMEANRVERAAIFGTLEGGTLATTFAATHPDRCSALVLYATFARTTPTEGYDWPPTLEERTARMAQAVEHWGEGFVAGGVAQSRMEDPKWIEWAGRLERLAASPATIERIFEVFGETDVRHVLPTVRVPTLVMHRRDDTFLKVEHSRYIAEQIPGARYVELEGSDNLFAMGDVEAVVGEIEEFLTGARHTPEPDRMLATVMFTDIVDSTSRAAQMGDGSWRSLLGRHDELMRRALERHRGREVKTMGDGFLATFDGPARAIRCASTVAQEMRELGIEVRAGLHTGELEVIGNDVGGLAVHIGARVMAQAGASEVLVSGTVKDLVAGSGLEFEDRGRRELKGVPGEWQLFAVA
jgi:class 3 adenylate cyclase